jgi:hypothetical protein
LDPAGLTHSGRLLPNFSSQFSETTMKNNVLKVSLAVLLMSGSALAFASDTCCGDMVECCLQMLACCL